MKTINIRFLLFTIALGGLVISSHGQNLPEEGTLGLRASLQSGQSTLEIPIWVSDNLVVAPQVGIVNEEDNFTSLTLGVKPRFYQSLGNDYASYLGGLLALQLVSPDVGDEITDIQIGVNGGGEYFLDPRFSLGVEGRLNWLLRDNDSNRLATGAAVTGTFYFISD